MYGQRLYRHMSLISHPYGNSSAPRDPYDPLLSVNKEKKNNWNQTPPPPHNSNSNKLTLERVLFNCFRAVAYIVY